MIETIDREALKAKLDRGENVTLVEALPPEHYRKEHLPGAINLPHDQVDELAAKLLPDKSTEIVIYCASGPCKNSGIAARRLAELGYTRVRDYHEGKADWVAAGYPVDTGESVAAMNS